MSEFRQLPSIDALLQRPAIGAAIELHGRAAVVQALRAAVEARRTALRAGDSAADVSASSADAHVRWIEHHAMTALAGRLRHSLRPVINATGVILHTNLGRAPLAPAAVAHASEIAAGYTNLEYDLDAGTRGHRHVHAERLLRELTGAEAALVVNNNAAATMLVLAAMASGREVVVSRGELVEIGGGFRVPEVMTQSGAALREVGTTNRTRITDYTAAVSDRTAMILRVHPSNFRIEGFTERPALADLAAAARQLGVPVFEDLGSGWLGLDDIDTPPALRDEPSVRASLAAGADLVAFSGDKLLGGPQCGIVAGRREFVDRARRHPLMRAVRADKIAYGLLEATLALWAQPSRRVEIPVWRMLTLTVDDIERRARELLQRLDGVADLRCRIVPGQSTIGGGSAPSSTLQTALVEVVTDGLSAAALDARLRAGSPLVVARIQDDALVVDLRTVEESDQATLAGAIVAAATPFNLQQPTNNQQ